MGGLGGHMFHLYDNPELTFGQIKDIFQKAATGQLVGTEKADGINLFISFSVRDGRARAARNKGNIEKGGLTVEELAQKYEGRGDIKEAFVDAFSAFEAAAKSLPIDTQIDIFGPDANIYYNSEIQDPRSTNVIKYDTKTLNIHRVGHMEIDKALGQATQEKDLSKQFSILEKVLTQKQNELNKQALATNPEYRIQTNAIIKLKELSDKKPLKIAITEINKLQSNNGLTDNDSIAQYLLNTINNRLQKEIPDLQEVTKKELLKRMLRVKGVTVPGVIKTIPKELHPIFVPKIKAFVENEKQIYKEAILPIENIVHNFAVEMLRTLKSAFILDHEKEAKRLRDELARAEQEIMASGDEKWMEVLKNQIKKIKNVENLTTAAEGFVFDYNGETYKFTGNFAPLNQILGFFKQDIRKVNVEPEQNLQEENTETGEQNKTAVVIFGRFNPPTIGHKYIFDFASDVAKKNNADLYIIPSRKVPSSRPDLAKNPLTFEEKFKYLNLMFPEYSKNIVNDSSMNTIFEAAKILYNQKGYNNLKAICGQDRVADYERLNIFNNQSYSFKNIEVISVGDRDPEAEDISGVSASKVREAALNDDYISFMKGCGKLLNPELAKELMSLIKKRITELDSTLIKKPSKKTKVANELATIAEQIFNEIIVKSGNKWCLKSKKKNESGKRKNLGCYSSKTKAKKRERQVNYFKRLKEMYIDESTAGAINGYAGYPNNHRAYDARNMQTRFGFGMSQKRDDDQLYTEEGNPNMQKIKRENFIEEIKLRSLVREAIRRKIVKNKKLVLQEENKLRQIIRRILKEGDEDMPHAFTGINVLEELLGIIMKIIEPDFKMLKTDKQQRDSFRAHIVNATKNLLASEKILDKLDEPQEEQLEEEESFKAENPKYIDVGLDKKKQEPEEVDTFTIQGQDETGRNLALKTFNKIEKRIKEHYQLLSNKKDKDLFYDYLITNLKLYFDKFESEMGANVEEPTSDTYDKEKQSALDTQQSQQPTDTGAGLQQPQSTQQAPGAPPPAQEPEMQQANKSLKKI
jgi:nicotinamide mononucleotide adenylyltransferase